MRGGSNTNESVDDANGNRFPRHLLGRDGFSPSQASVFGADHWLTERTHRFLGKSTSNPFFMARW